MDVDDNCYVLAHPAKGAVLRCYVIVSLVSSIFAAMDRIEIESKSNRTRQSQYRALIFADYNVAIYLKQVNLFPMQTLTLLRSSFHLSTSSFRSGQPRGLSHSSRWTSSILIIRIRPRLGLLQSLLGSRSGCTSTCPLP
jgi:hypothetical protein